VQYELPTNPQAHQTLNGYPSLSYVGRIANDTPARRILKPMPKSLMTNHSNAKRLEPLMQGILIRLKNFSKLKGISKVALILF